MTPGQRRWIFLAGAVGLVAFVLWGLIGLPGFGHYPGPYGFIINRIALRQTHATGTVSAVNFDYRGFDTGCRQYRPKNQRMWAACYWAGRMLMCR